MRRQVAVVPHSKDLYGVQCRERARFWPWFGRWRHLCFVEYQTRAWPYAEARQLADQVLDHGVVPSPFCNAVYPVVEKDDEVES